MNRLLKRALLILGVVALGLMTLVPSTRVLSETNNTNVLLNGLIAKDASGRTDEKTATLASGSTVRSTYSLVPQYAEGFTQGTKVYVFLPSFSYDASTDTYKQLGPNDTPSSLGISARVSADDTWEVSGNGVQNGGWISLTYSGNLIAGSNPAFEISFSAYSDGTSGPMGALPEGTVIDIHGYVEYENYNSQANSSWITHDNYDTESVLKLVSSNLTWEATIEHFDGPNPKAVPMWDRYQYLDYRYEIENTSDNPKSKVEGYTVTFDIDSAEDSINGILPYDVNLWRRLEDGTVVENEDRTDFTGEFVGVPDRGGILIYDITNLNDDDPLPEPLTYTYSGVGVIALDQTKGDDKIELGSKSSNIGSNRVYKVSIPLSRQGFPNLPTLFNVSAITNIVYAKNQNWSKTDNMSIEIIEPEYLAGINKTGPNASVFGVETSFTVKEIVNRSNVPFFDLELKDTLNEDFHATRIEISQSEDRAYNFNEMVYVIDTTYNAITDTTTHTEHILEPKRIDDKYVYDLSEYEESDLWDRTLRFKLDSRLEVAQFVPLSFEIFGVPSKIGNLHNEATLNFIEKRANNTDYSLETSYENTENVSIKDDHTINIVYPDPVKPNNLIQINGLNTLTLDYNSNFDMGLKFGLEAMSATAARFSLNVNDATKPIGLIVETIDIDPKLYDVTTLQSFEIIGSLGKVNVDISKLSKTEIETISLKELGIGDLLEIKLEMGEFEFKGLETYLSLKGKTHPSISREHPIVSDFEADQGQPYNNSVSSLKTSKIKVVYPQELKINARLTSNYASLSAMSVYPAPINQTSNASLSVPYEASVQTRLDLGTASVVSPRYRVHFTYDDASKNGHMSAEKFELKQSLLDSSDSYSLSVTDTFGKSYSFGQTDFNQTVDGVIISFLEYGITDISAITLELTNFKNDGLEPLIVLHHDADTDLGSTQNLNVTIQGSQNMPYTSDAMGKLVHTFNVQESKTSVSVQAFHQEGQSLGSSSFSEYVYRQRYYGYNYYNDYTLDMPYKGMGGFSTSIIRPTTLATNNNEIVALTVDVPQEQFDMYSLRLKASLKPFMTSVDIYRIIDGESKLWKTVLPSDWVDNALDGPGNFRINTAHASNDGTLLTMSEPDGTALETHPYYKSPWHQDVKPEMPVDKVVINLQFDRVHGEIPELAGTHNNVIDTLGRFYEVSKDTKKATNVKTDSTIGIKRPIKRDSTATIYSAVHNSFALSETGAQDQVSFDKGSEGVQEKIVRMGQNGHFLVGLKNGQNTYNPFHTSNPIVSVPSEYNEFIYTSDNTYHHDTLIYSMNLPANYSENDTFYYDFTSMHLEDSVYKYLDTIAFINTKGEKITVTKDQLNGIKSLTFNVEALHKGYIEKDGDIVMSFGDGTYVSDVEVSFVNIPGFSGSNSEVKGLDEDMLGSRLPVTDIRFTGGVYGNNRLVGTSSLYRQYTGSTQRTLLGTSDAVLIGYTPRLGASVQITQNTTTVHDYLEDGLTPTSHHFSLDVWNAHEVDINKVELQFTPDSDFRAKLISIPQAVFDGDFWKVDRVHISSGTEIISVASKDFKQYFTLNTVSGNYEMDIEDAFDRGLFTARTSTSKYNASIFSEEYISGVIAVITPRNTLLYGSLSKELDDTLSSHILENASEMMISGIYADKSQSDVWDYESKPSFATDSLKANQNTHSKNVTNRVSAFVTPTESVYINHGSTNNSQKPTTTITTHLMNRVARMTLATYAVDSNLDSVESITQFVDGDTLERIPTNSLAPGDQTEQIFELKNTGVNGNLPVFNPNFVINVPEGLEVIELEIIDATSLIKLGSKEYLGGTVKAADLSQVRVNDLPVAEALNLDLRPVTQIKIDFLNQNLQFGESFTIRLKFEVSDNYSVLHKYQNKVVTWHAFARPDMTHSYMSYDINGINGNLNKAGGTSEVQNFDGLSGNEYYAVTSNHDYRFANPYQTVIESSFDTENISGETMRIETSNVWMETHHDNTDVTQEIIFDTSGLKGFELKALPEISYPAWMNRTQKPEVEILGVDLAWSSLLDTLNSEDLKQVQGLRITYRNMPRNDSNNNPLFLPNYALEGVAYWRSINPSSKKTFDLVSQVKVMYTHLHPDKTSVFEQVQSDTVTVYKAIPLMEFNVQSFDSQSEALETYDASKIGKASYRPGDRLWMKLTATNLSRFQAQSSNSAFGKAPLKNPIIIDRVPEYLLTPELDVYITGSNFDLQKALQDGVMTMTLNSFSQTERDGDIQNLLATPRTFKLPKVSVHEETGVDVGGAQYFNKTSTRDGSGYLSNNNTSPSNTTLNPANTIRYKVFTYTFEDEQIDRGGRLEITYPSIARMSDLPQARYSDDTRAIYAPYEGWNTGQTPTHATAANTIMSMASLLHDVGISGERDDYILEGEFLAESIAHLPGTNTLRNNTDIDAETYYDDSANMASTHTAVLKDYAASSSYKKESLYVTRSGSVRESDTSAYVSRKRLESVTIPSKERMLWASDGVNLSKSWLYSASEMVPLIERKSHGVDYAANYYEHDGNVSEYDIQHLGASPYIFDDYTYAVELHEVFTLKMHVANYGDYGLKNGVLITEILPVGISPYSDGQNLNLKIMLGDTVLDASMYEVRVIQTPTTQNPIYKAPAQNQEYETIGTTQQEGVPYVVEIEVKTEIGPWFNRGSGTSFALEAHLEVKVTSEPPIESDDISYWYDELRVRPRGDVNHIDNMYYEIYDGRYGGMSAYYGTYNRTRLQNDAVTEGMLSNTTLVPTGSYADRNYIYEPYGHYIRGKNAQTSTRTIDGYSNSVSGDQIAMRKAALRIWSEPVDESNEYETSINGFSADLYDSFDLKVNIDNFQYETSPTHYRGDPRYTGTNANSEHWVMQPQTIGGAKGSWFEPVVTIRLQYGLAYDQTLSRNISKDFKASLYDMNAKTKTFKEDVTNLFEVEVSHDTDALGRDVQVLVFSLIDQRSLVIKDSQSLTLTPRVKVIDVPDDQDARSLNNPGGKYEDIEVEATSNRHVFNPITPTLYQTGSTPRVNTWTSYAGGTILNNDRLRLDSSSAWTTSLQYSGAMAISQRLNGDTKELVDEYQEPKGAMSTSVLLGKVAHIHNETSVGLDPFSEQEVALVDAAGKYWHTTKVTNDNTLFSDKLIQVQQTSDIFHSDFLVTYLVSPQSEFTGNYALKFNDNGVEKVVDTSNAHSNGVQVELKSVSPSHTHDGRLKVQFLIKLPIDNRLGIRGRLDHGTSFTFTFESKMVRSIGSVSGTGNTWVDPVLNVDSYVSLIPVEGTSAIQDPVSNFYSNRVEEIVNSVDIDGDSLEASVFAQDGARIEIIKPQALVRKNTTRPRIMYSNGKSGDNYFNSSEVIEYLITHAENTGSGVKEMIVEDRIPSDESKDSSQSLTANGLNTKVLYLSTGKWMIPDASLKMMQDQNISVNDAFKVFVYVSDALGTPSYDDLSTWTLLNPSGSSVEKSETIQVPLKHQNLKQVRWVVKAMNPDTFLIPNGFKLAVDTHEDVIGNQSVIDSDPLNHATERFGDGVKDNALQLGLIASSDVKHTLYLYNEARLWLNYVADDYYHATSSQTRSYLTPSRPVVNIDYDASYYRRNVSSQSNADRFTWSDVMIVNPTVSPHLKFKATFTNADESMWLTEESDVYQEDSLINPHITIELPRTVKVDGSNLNYVPYESINATSPLSDEYRSQYALTDKQTNIWTWRIERSPKNSMNTISHIELANIDVGAWGNSPYNVFNIGFTGTLYPGDKVIVEILGTISDYAPGSQSQNLQSSAKITNNTGLLQPLNSILNITNKLGYELDSYDYNNNKLNNDRVVFAERQLFEYSSYDNFSKRKTVYTDLNPAGSVHPAASPVSEGGVYRFETSLDNSKDENANPYPYPIIYDVLPSINDTLVTQNKARNSAFEGKLRVDSIKLQELGVYSKTFTKNEYDIFVGPFEKNGASIKQVNLPDHASAASQDFYMDMTDPIKRGKYFINLNEIENDPVLLDQIQAILVLFKDPLAELKGQRKLVLSYEMKAPLNTVILNERSQSNQNFNAYTSWNSFVGTQKVQGFMPQESNLAGVYVSEKLDKSYIGNYIWMDYNNDAIQNEGEIVTDVNGRKLLQNFKDVNGDGVKDDPGVNGIKVSLLSPQGRYVDLLGQSIELIDGSWIVVDDLSGTPLKDDVFSDVITSKGPVSYLSESDVHGNAGYFTLSNISNGDYRLMYEAPQSLTNVGVTSTSVYKDTSLSVFTKGDTINVGARNWVANSLTIISDVFNVNASVSDSDLMSFDIGLGETTTVGGTVFLEDSSTVDGIYTPLTETGISGYKVRLVDEKGIVQVNLKGQKLEVDTDTNGEYIFEAVPFTKQYRVQVEAINGPPSRKLSPFIFGTTPLHTDNENDGMVSAELGVVTHPFKLDKKYKDLRTIDIGYYDTSRFASIGNRVWLDSNRNGIQDLDEVGISDVRMNLNQYILRNGEFQMEPSFSQSLLSNQDGYYYFEKLPTSVFENGVELLTAYDVSVDSLPDGLTFTQALKGDSLIDSDFNPNGKRYLESDVALIKLQETLGSEVIYQMDIDLGLVPYDLGSIEGVTFNDSNSDGLNLTEKPLEGYKVRIQVRDGNDFVDVMIDEKGVMIEPGSQQIGSIYEISTPTYKFENLKLVNTTTKQVYEYRLIATPLKAHHDLTLKNSGLNRDEDSDYHVEIVNGIETLVTDSMTLVMQSKAGDLEPFNLYQAESKTHVDLGIIVHKLDVFIGNIVYEDFNNNGLQDADENGIENINLMLQIFDTTLNRWIETKDLNGISQTLSDKDGKYQFHVSPANLDPNSPEYLVPYEYRVMITKSAYSKFAHYESNLDETLNSDVTEILEEHVAVSRSAIIGDLQQGLLDIKSFKDDTDIDFGLTLVDPYRIIGDKVWLDENENGLQDVLEKGLEGIEVVLYTVDENGGLHETQRTYSGPNGYYEFKVVAYDGNSESITFMQANKYAVGIVNSTKYRLSPIHLSDLMLNSDVLIYNDEYNVSHSMEFTMYDDTSNIYDNHRDDLNRDFGLVEIPEAATNNPKDPVEEETKNPVVEPEDSLGNPVNEVVATGNGPIAINVIATLIVIMIAVIKRKKDSGNHESV